MFLNTFKIFIASILITSTALAQSISFNPPDGWIKNEDLSIKGEKLVFTPQNINQKPSESLTITYQKINAGAGSLLWNNLIDIQKEYKDFKYYKPLFSEKEAMGLGCSVEGSFCIVQRIEQFDDNLYLYTYKNSYPHYSQGFFGKWTNICSEIEIQKEDKDNGKEVFEI